MKPQIRLVVSIDAEEDNWQPARNGVTVENIRNLPRMDRILESLGVRPTLFIAYQVATDPRAAGIIRELNASGRVEIGAHLHPWNTPPECEDFLPRNTMTMNLPSSLQAEKIATLTSTLTETFGARPQAFRTGRWGLGPATVAALIEAGYRVDSSVTPFKSWAEVGEGPDHTGAPLRAYTLAAGADVRVPVEGGLLLELPVSWAFNRRPFRFWGAVHRRLMWRPLRAARLSGVAAVTGLLRKIALSPEIHSVDNMIVLSKRLIADGLPFLHMFWHSPTACPGLTPFATTRAQSERMYAAVEEYVERLAGLADVQFATVGEMAENLVGGGSVVSMQRPG